MKLYTVHREDDYDRIVDIFVNKSKNEIPYLEDRDTCKLVLIKKGHVKVCVENSDCADREQELKAPVVLLIPNRDTVTVQPVTSYQATTVFFKPTAIHDDFTYDRLYNGEFEDKVGSAIFQDYVLIRSFIVKDNKALNYISLTDSATVTLVNMIEKMAVQLNQPKDGYWPCRSRSFFIELLFFLDIYYVDNFEFTDDKPSFTANVIEYLNQHIDEKLDLDEITKQFHVNRNVLNKAFMDETGLTCLQYLLKLRMDLAKLWLAETAIPISEIGRRLGYMDNNYFAKVFRKECDMSPSAYRDLYYED